ncbi:hypothetical protein VPH35_085179 [Triticum aestivum]
MASGSRGDMDGRRWSDLPADVLREVSGRVRAAADFVSFHAVCKKWRGSRDPPSRARATRTQFLPWLLAPPDEEPDHLKFRCVFSKASYRVVPPSPVPRRNWVCSTDGAGVWYLAVDEHLRPSLHDPLTGAVAHLPTFPWGEGFNPCGVIYDDGTTFLHSYNERGWFRAALLRPGDAEWTAVERTLEAPSIWYREFCATYHGGKIMVTADASLWHVLTPDGDDGDDVLVPSPPPCLPSEEEPSSRQYSHVLESCGELLWVVVQVQLRSYTPMSGLRPVLSVLVHALGEETTSSLEKKTRWVRKDGHSLTDRVLFLGWAVGTAGVSTSSTVKIWTCHVNVKRSACSGTTSSMTRSYYGRQNNLELIERLPQGSDEGRNSMRGR